ncbi:hypothetical protein YC2023_080960 [Brassica napus]
MAAPQLTCVLLVETEFKGWQKTLHKIFVGIEGLAFSIDAPDWWPHGEGANPMMFTKKLLFLRGQVDPVVFIKKLFKAKIYAMLYRIDYGLEENPLGIRKPNNHFLRFRFEIDMLEGSWYKKIIGALKTIQGLQVFSNIYRYIRFGLVFFNLFVSSMSGVSFTIDAPSQMVYMCGNIEEGLLLKMLTKTGIQILGMDYGNLKPPPKKVEAQISDGTETQPKKDTEPPPPPPEIVVTKHQAKNKKPRGRDRAAVKEFSNDPDISSKKSYLNIKLMHLLEEALDAVFIA